MTELDEPDMHWVGHTLVDRDRIALGQVAEVYDDAESGQPQWALVYESAVGESVLVPLAGAEEDPLVADTLRVDVTLTQVLAAPRVPIGDVVTVADEERLRDHYRTAPAGDDPAAASGPDDDTEQLENPADASTGPMEPVDVDATQAMPMAAEPEATPSARLEPEATPSARPATISRPDPISQPKPVSRRDPTPASRPAASVPTPSGGARPGAATPVDLGADEARRAAQRRRVAAITGVGGAVVVLSGLAARRRRSTVRSRIKSLRQP